MAEAAPKKKFRSTGSLFVGAAVGILLGIILANTVPDESVGTVWIGFLAILLTGIAVHEFGHALATILVRFDLISISIGPLTLLLGSGGTRLRLSGIGLGGLTMAVPKGTEHLRQRFLVMIAAGPAASLIAGFMAVAAGRYFQSSTWAGWLSAWGYGSLALALLSLCPTRRFYYSDGARMAQLLRSTPAAERNCAMLAIGAAASGGTRPRDWDPELLRVACAACDDGSGDGLRSALIGYENAMDTGKYDEAGRFLDLALAGINSYPPMAKAGVALDAAFFHAMVRADTASARAWLEKSNTKLVHDRYAVLLVESAVLLAEGRIADANRKAVECRAALPRATFAGFARAAEDWLNIIAARCQTSVAAVSSEH